jgi:integrase
MEEYTLGCALKLWETSKDAKSVGTNFDKYLSIALRLYVFPELDPNAENLKMEDFTSFCERLPVTQLKGALDIFEQRFAKAVEKGRTSRSTGRNYRSSLRRFTNWLEKQAWWRCLFPDPIAKVSPFREKSPPLPKSRERHSPYGLSKDELPSHVLEELEEFKQFRLTGGRNIRRTVGERRRYREEGEARKPKIDAIKPSTLLS